MEAQFVCKGNRGGFVQTSWEIAPAVLFVGMEVVLPLHNKNQARSADMEVGKAYGYSLRRRKTGIIVRDQNLRSVFCPG
jgi:hypothetical protein